MLSVFFSSKTFLQRNIFWYLSECRVSLASRGPQFKTWMVHIAFLYDRTALENLTYISWLPTSNPAVLLNTFHIFVCLYCRWVVKIACMCVCMYVRTYVYMYVCMYVCICVCVWMHVCMCVDIHTYIYVCICECVCECMYAHMFTYIYVCMYVCVCMCKKFRN
jgi:hypothetical protein